VTWLINTWAEPNMSLWSEWERDSEQMREKICPNSLGVLLVQRDNQVVLVPPFLIDPFKRMQSLHARSSPGNKMSLTLRTKLFLIHNYFVFLGYIWLFFLSVSLIMTRVTGYKS